MKSPIVMVRIPFQAMELSRKPRKKEKKESAKRKRRKKVTSNRCRVTIKSIYSLTSRMTWLIENLCKLTKSWKIILKMLRARKCDRLRAKMNKNRAKKTRKRT